MGRNTNMGPFYSPSVRVARWHNRPCHFPGLYRIFTATFAGPGVLGEFAPKFAAKFGETREAGRRLSRAANPGTIDVPNLGKLLEVARCGQVTNQNLPVAPVALFDHPKHFIVRPKKDRGSIPMAVASESVEMA